MEWRYESKYRLILGGISDFLSSKNIKMFI